MFCWPLLQQQAIIVVCVIHQIHRKQYVKNGLTKHLIFLTFVNMMIFFVYFCHVDSLQMFWTMCTTTSLGWSYRSKLKPNCTITNNQICQNNTIGNENEYVHIIYQKLCHAIVNKWFVIFIHNKHSFKSKYDHWFSIPFHFKNLCFC